MITAQTGNWVVSSVIVCGIFLAMLAIATALEKYSYRARYTRYRAILKSWCDSLAVDGDRFNLVDRMTDLPQHVAYLEWGDTNSKRFNEPLIGEEFPWEIDLMVLSEKVDDKTYYIRTYKRKDEQF